MYRLIGLLLRLGSVLIALGSPVVFGQYQYFDDVPPTAPYFGTVNLMWQRQLTHGCSYDPHLYCPDSLQASRGDMAVFLVRAIYSALTGDPESFTPPSTPYFTDVPATHPRFRYIQQLRYMGVTIGYGSETVYSPDSPLTNAQAATFTVRARQVLEGSSVYYGYVTLGVPNDNLSCPYDFQCYAYFPNDVPSTNYYFKFVQKAREWAGPMIQAPDCPYGFCPDAPATRGQISFYVVYGILGQPAIAPQQSYQAGWPFRTLAAISGMNCNASSFVYQNDIYLLSS